jgi:nitrate/nitrite transport system substrate-binding protein
VLGGAGNGIDGAHILTPLPYLMQTGKVVQNGQSVPMNILARLNTNGQAISVSKALQPHGATLNAAPLKAAFAAKTDNKVAMTFRGGTHDLWLRYWLAAGGIDPDRDVQTIVVPPPQMVANMKVGTMDAFCVGEPWNDQLVHQDMGYTACVTGEIWKDHPEKSLGMRADWVAKNPKAAAALTAAVIEAQIWCEAIANKDEMAAILGKRAWFNVPPADIAPRARGDIDFGDGRKLTGSPLRMKFFADHASYPFQSHELWFLTEDIRWGVLPQDTDTKALVSAVNREDIWKAGARLAGVSDIPGSTSRGVETFFDGKVFDPAAPEKYLADLAIKKLSAA